MIKKISIKNYKSIVSDEIELGRVNVFIGENGAGKSNILEAVGMFSAAKSGGLSIEGLYNKGVRVTKPGLMFSSFLGVKQRNKIDIDVELVESKQKISIASELTAESPDDIYTKWKDKKYPLSGKAEWEDTVGQIVNETSEKAFRERPIKYGHVDETDIRLLSVLGTKFYPFIVNFQIYTASTSALRGITRSSYKQPLGIYGEGLDLLLSTFNEQEWQLLRDYSHFISWLQDIVTDEKDTLKFDGHKLGRSTSTLYFRDQYMRKNNNIFAAENANEGALYVLFYLALFISKKTPSFFAIDNIETALNPKICRALIGSITELAEKMNKQVLITTHNPAILDGIDLNNDNERLFVVSRTDEGRTKTKRIQFKPQNGQVRHKLSELWMRGRLGGIPQNFL